MGPPKRSRVRVIAGQWRGRRLDFPAAPGLRPSPDRVRETLFNWLAGTIAGARCLDLFAGSGVLGFEALSRGAAQVTLVDNNVTVVSALRATQKTLGADGATLIAADALAFIKGLAPRSFDIIFLDPPFGTTLLADALTAILAGDIVTPGGLLYIETAHSLPRALPPGLRWHRTSQAGAVAFGLAARLL